jgi:hypothetical protein
MNRLAFAPGNDDDICAAIRFSFRVIAIRLLALCLCLAAGQLSAGDFYASPTGNDLNPGTKRKSFASLERARDAAREQKQREPERDYTVWLRGGVCRF